MTQRRTAQLAPGLVFAATLLAAVLGFGLYYDHESAAATARALASLDRDLAREGWSSEVRQMAAWTIRTNDHHGLPFAVIDQAHARLFAFDEQGRLAGSAPILHDAVGAEESAPAGRFVADMWHLTHADAIVWTNDRAMVWLDPAPPRTHAHEPFVIAYGHALPHHHRTGLSLHIPGTFYRQHLHAFLEQASVAYILPGEPGVHRSLRGYAAQRATIPHQPRSV